MNSLHSERLQSMACGFALVRPPDIVRDGDATDWDSAPWRCGEVRSGRSCGRIPPVSGKAPTRPGLVARARTRFHAHSRRSCEKADAILGSGDRGGSGRSGAGPVGGPGHATRVGARGIELGGWPNNRDDEADDAGAAVLIVGDGPDN